MQGGGAGGFLIDADFLCVFFLIMVALPTLQDECFNEQKPTSSSVNKKKENSHGNIVVNGLQQLAALWGDFYLHL